MNVRKQNTKVTNETYDLLTGSENRAFNDQLLNLIPKNAYWRDRWPLEVS